MMHDPLADLFSAMANWRAAVLMTEGRDPEVDLHTRTAPAPAKPGSWRLEITVDGAIVVAATSRNAGQLAIDAERDFRTWADERDLQENEARLAASVQEATHG